MPTEAIFPIWPSAMLKPSFERLLRIDRCNFLGLNKLYKGAVRQI